MRSIARADRPGADLWAARLLGLVVALAVCAPLLGRGGYTLVYDMVFVPDPAFTAHAWGGDGSVPRAVPADAVLAGLGRVLPMWLVQQVLLLLAVGASVLGAWRVSPARTVLGAAAGAMAFGWGAYQAERLAMGHWSLLLGIALLPWVLKAALDTVGQDRRPWLMVVLVGLGAVAAPSAGALTAGLALVLMLVLPWRAGDRLMVVASAVVLNATWAVPGLLAEARLDRDAIGVAAFATASDTPYGVVVSALTGGGVWNRLVHLESRALPTSAALGLLMVLIAVLGTTGCRRWWRGEASGRAAGAVAGLGLVGLLLALTAATPIGADAVTWATGHVPGAGLLRDGQKWLGWWLLPVSLGVGPGLERLVSSFPPVAAAFLLGCGALVPVIATPDYAWGVAGRLDAVAWPDEYADVTAAVNAAPDPGGLLVLPWHAFRAWDWNDHRTVLDPWQRWVDRPVVARDDLELVRRSVPGEDPIAGRVGELVTSAAGEALDAPALRDLGIRYVLLDLSTAGQDGVSVDGTPLVDGPRLRLLDLGPVGSDPVRDARPEVVAVVDLLVLGWLGLAVLAESRHRGRGMLRFASRPSNRRN